MNNYATKYCFHPLAESDHTLAVVMVYTCRLHVGDAYYPLSLHFHVSAIAPKPVYDNLAMEPVRKYQNTQINVEDFEAFIETGESEMLKQYEVWSYHCNFSAYSSKF